MNIVQVEVKRSYGQDRIYPANKEAELFLFLTGKKTFDTADLNFIKNLGFQVEEITTTKLESIQ